MKKLSKARFEKAAAFVQAQAREVDKRLFDFYFGKATAVAVLEALAAYQNEDGGFGHGIEPDFRLRASSPMATSVGLQYCVTMNAPANHPLIQKAMGYLVDTYDWEHHYWPATYKNVNDEPHAFWWHVDKLSPPTEIQWPNPSAEIVGYIHRYHSLVPADLLNQATRRAEANLNNSPIISGETPQKYNVMCWERAMSSLPGSLSTAVADAIRRTFAAYPSIQADTFEELGILALASHPDSILAHLAPDAIQQALDREIDNQAEDGGWWPGWHWGQYEDVWPIAQQEWAGKITVHTLHTLHTYGRIE
ncbi:MAG: hypothetical protein H6667_08700 [Ardenticatenaceae bacterium]|nr:hypothetical protein [Ardenticatenaceae bacterium]MCB9445370.1 hypothetical protein [Ardenticatenaceae bacterium]